MQMRNHKKIAFLNQTCPRRDEEHIVFVRVHDLDGNENTYYVHEVFLASELNEKGDTLQTAAEYPEQRAQATRRYRTL